MKKFAVSSLVCLALFCCSLMLFTGCDNTQYTYAEFQSAYKNFVTENEGELFDSNGYVKITYKNESMDVFINKTDLDSKMTKFTRLSSSLDSNQAIFEPALKASLVFVKNYVNVSADTVPTSVSTDLYNKFLDFKAKAEKFLLVKKNFDNLETSEFNPDNALQVSWLNMLLEDFYNLVKSSCEFSQKYIEVYNQYIFIDAPNTIDGRIATGKIAKYYIESLTKLADVYINSYLPSIYDKTLIVDDSEYYTDQYYCKDVNSVLKSYLDIDEKIIQFERRTGAMTDAEKAVVTAYNSAIEYNTVFENSYKMVLEILPKVDLSKDNFSEIEQGFVNLLNDFYTCEYKNLTQLINTISQKILVA